MRPPQTPNDRYMLLMGLTLSGPKRIRDFRRAVRNLLGLGPLFWRCIEINTLVVTCGKAAAIGKAGVVRIRNANCRSRWPAFIDRGPSTGGVFAVSQKRDRAAFGQDERLQKSAVPPIERYAATPFHRLTCIPRQEPL